MDHPFKLAVIGNPQPTMLEAVGRQLHLAGVNCIHGPCDGPSDLEQLAADADALWIAGYPEKHGLDGWRDIVATVLPKLTRCGAIIRPGSGTDNVPVDVATALNILVVNTPQATAAPVAEFTVGLMLAVSRQIVRHAVAVRAGEHSSDEPTQASLQGKTLGLVGFGLIARLVAQYVRGFEMRVIAADPAVEAAEMGKLGVTKVELPTLLAEADYVSLHCPLVKATHRLMGAPQFEQMKPSAILINTSRGGVVDEPALIRALEAGQIAGAGLDVLEQEPMDPANALMHMDNVVVTPHVAAMTEQIHDDLLRLGVESVIDLASGYWPRSFVNCVTPRWPLQNRPAT